MQVSRGYVVEKTLELKQIGRMPDQEATSLQGDINMFLLGEKEVTGRVCDTEQFM